MAELIMPFPGYPGYFATCSGNIWFKKKNVFLKNYTSANGYLLVSIRGENKLAHRLVCAAFHGAPKDGQQVNHKNGRKNDNHWSNLEWVTNKENCIHSRRVLMTGARPVKAVSQKTGETILFKSLALAEEAGFTRSLIQKCISGKRSHHKHFKWFDAAIDRAMAEGREGK